MSHTNITWINFAWTVNIFRYDVKCVIGSYETCLVMYKVLEDRLNKILLRFGRTGCYRLNKVWLIKRIGSWWDTREHQLNSFADYYFILFAVIIQHPMIFVVTDQVSRKRGKNSLANNPFWWWKRFINIQYHHILGIDFPEKSQSYSKTKSNIFIRSFLTFFILWISISISMNGMRQWLPMLKSNKISQIVFVLSISDEKIK